MMAAGEGGTAPPQVQCDPPLQLPRNAKILENRRSGFPSQRRKAFKPPMLDFSSGPVVKYLPTNAGLISSQGRFHMPKVNLSSSTTTVGPVIYKGSHSNEKPEHLHVESSPCSPQLEKACMQQPNSTLAKQQQQQQQQKQKQKPT